MSISIDALRSYVEKIAKKVLNDESSKPVISGTIKSSLPGIYEVQLVNGNETSLIRAESLYADKTFAVDDYVYLVRAENNRGDEYETKYFIVGLVTTVEQNFANLTEWERFLGDGQKIISKFNNDVIIISQDTNIEDNPSATENEANNFTNFINAVRTNGVFLFSTKVSTEIKKETTFGFEFIFTFDDNSTKTEFFSGLSFIGQPWSLKEVAQKKIFDLGTQNTLKSITITKVKPNNGTFDATDISLESGTFLNLAQDFKVTLENVKGKNYFNKIDNKYVAQIKANVNYGNQKLDTKALKYYWFVKLYDDYYLSIAEKSASFQDVLKKYKIDLSETDDNIIKDGQINRQVLEEILKDNDNKENIINKISMTWFEVRTAQTNENSLGGVGWNCLNDFSYAKIINKNGITERKDVLIYKTDDNILEIDYNKAQEWLINYENEIKCVVGYQLVNATSEPIKIYNFKHESYEVTIEKISGENPILYANETITLTAKVSSKTVGGEFSFEWYNKNGKLKYDTSEKDENGTVKKEDYIKNTLTISGDNTKKSSKSLYAMAAANETFYCRLIVNGNDFGKSNEYTVVSRAGEAQVLEDTFNYKYWINEANNIRFISEEKEEIIYGPNSEGIVEKFEDKDKYLEYKTESGIFGESAISLEWLNGTGPFAELDINKSYYLYYSEQKIVVDKDRVYEQNKKLPVRFDDYSKPKILRQVFVNSDDIVVDMQTAGSIEKLNTFNDLTNGGRSQGINYTDAAYDLTTTFDKNKLNTGEGYYEKIDTYKYTRIGTLPSFEQGVEYYYSEDNGVSYTKETNETPVKDRVYYKKELVKTDYILRPQDRNNYNFDDNDKPAGFLPNERYYEQNGGDLYINASFIRSGHLEVSDGEKTVFSADLENNDITIDTDPLVLKKDGESYHLAINTTPIQLSRDDSDNYNLTINTDKFTLIDGNITATGGTIGGFHITENHLASGEAIDTDPHSVLISPGYGGDDSNGKFAFWAGDRTGVTDDTRPFWVKTDGSVRATKLIISQDNVENLTDTLDTINLNVNAAKDSADDANKFITANFLVDKYPNSSNKSYIYMQANDLIINSDKLKLNHNGTSITQGFFSINTTPLTLKNIADNNGNWGSLAGFTLKSNSISKETNEGKIYLGTDKISLGKEDNFNVDYKGVLTAQSFSLGMPGETFSTYITNGSVRVGAGTSSASMKPDQVLIGYTGSNTGLEIKKNRFYPSEAFTFKGTYSFVSEVSFNGGIKPFAIDLSATTVSRAILVNYNTNHSNVCGLSGYVKVSYGIKDPITLYFKHGILCGVETDDADHAKLKGDWVNVK